MKTLQALLTHLALTDAPALASQKPAAFLSEPVTQLTSDSRRVAPGSVFVALPGAKCHGIDFASQACEQGASAILTDLPGLAKVQASGLMGSLSCPVYAVADLQKKLAKLGQWFYDDPSRQLKVMGITGTNGKTSSAYFAAQLLQAVGFKVALMGTLGNGLLGDLQPSPNTTVDVLTLNHLLADFARQGVNWVVMEVSSHAVSLGRIAGLTFEVAALTQVTRDHLDFHGTEAAYREAKQQFFQTYPAHYQVLNLEDALGRALADKADKATKAANSAESLANKDASVAPTQIIGYSRKKADADVRIEALQYDPMGFSGQLVTREERIEFTVPLMGDFNAENLLCAVASVLTSGVTLRQIAAELGHLKGVPGRMEGLSRSGEPTVLIDYAHTPDALDRVLKALNCHLSAGAESLWVVFGCGGNRDAGKRPLMGQVAERYSDHIVLTDDNPRFESPEQIVADIQAGMQNRQAWVIHDRAEAVAQAIRQAREAYGERAVVLVAGKGHEDYQEIAGQRWPMQDSQLVVAAFQSRPTKMKQESQNP